MTKMEQILAFGQNIGREFRPERVLLFGSHVRGTATSDSDVDLLIVLPFQGRSVRKSVDIRLKLRPPFPVDLLVRTPEQMSERLAMGDDFMREILQEGIVLYEGQSSL